jgi:hypothetical protein
MTRYVALVDGKPSSHIGGFYASASVPPPALATAPVPAYSELKDTAAVAPVAPEPGAPSPAPISKRTQIFSTHRYCQKLHPFRCPRPVL